MVAEPTPAMSHSEDEQILLTFETGDSHDVYAAASSQHESSFNFGMTAKYRPCLMGERRGSVTKKPLTSGVR